MKLERKPQGSILPQFRNNYDQIEDTGNICSIEKFPSSLFGCILLFIAGNSEGDQNMIHNLANNQKVLIHDRSNKPNVDTGRFSRLIAQGVSATH